MFNRTALKKQCVSIIFTREKIDLFYFHLTPNALELHAYESHSYESPYLTVYVYNMPKIIEYITQFFAQHDCKQAYLFFGVHGSPVTQKIIVCTNIAEENIVPFPSEHTHQSGTHYLYPTENNTHIFYAWSIPHTLVFQLQLITHILQKNVIAIMPYWSCLFQLYKRWYFPAFRQLQLAQDMERCNHDITQFFSLESCYRLVNCKIPLTNDTYINALYAARIIHSYKELL